MPPQLWGLGSPLLGSLIWHPSQPIQPSLPFSITQVYPTALCRAMGWAAGGSGATGFPPEICTRTCCGAHCPHPPRPVPLHSGHLPSHALRKPGRAAPVHAVSCLPGRDCHPRPPRCVCKLSLDCCCCPLPPLCHTHALCTAGHPVPSAMSPPCSPADLRPLDHPAPFPGFLPRIRFLPCGIPQAEGSL